MLVSQASPSYSKGLAHETSTDTILLLPMAIQCFAGQLSSWSSE